MDFPRFSVDRLDQTDLDSDSHAQRHEVEEVAELAQERDRENVDDLLEVDAVASNGGAHEEEEEEVGEARDRSAVQDSGDDLGMVPSEATTDEAMAGAGASSEPRPRVSPAMAPGNGLAGSSRKSSGSHKITIESPPIRLPKPSLSYRLAAAPPNKHLSPCSGDHSHSHQSASPKTSHLSFLKSSSPASLARRIEAGLGDASPGNAGANSKSSPSFNRRHSMGAPGNRAASSPSTATSRRVSLDSSTPAKAATHGGESRRLSLSARSVPLQLRKQSGSPSSSSSLRGPSFGKGSPSLASPRSSSRPATPDSAKRSSPAGGASKHSGKSALSSPRTPIASTSSPFSSIKTSPSNSASGTTANRRRVSPVVVTPSIRLNSNSLDNPKSTSATHSPTSASSSSSFAKRPASPLSSERAPRKSLTSESRDSRFLSLPSIDVKAGDDVRLDLRGQKVRSLDCNLVNLTPKLEFVYLRDNKLSTLTGIEILKRVKVLDLSFNEFKGSGFEPLASCKALQQLYLAGNQITSLGGLPQLPNLEFLSVAQNKLKSLAMSTQPRLQVLAASKNEISTFKGFPDLPMLEHLRLEENPLSDMQHVEAAAILLAGPTLKKFNDKDLPLEEQTLARMYPAETSICIREGWELCDVKEASESCLQFLTAQWVDKIPPGYAVEKASIDQPAEGDPCRCHFTFKEQNDRHQGLELNLQYQWFLGGKIPTNFVPIEGATQEVYWPKQDDNGYCLKVECTPTVGTTEYPAIFAVSLPVSPGTGCPKILSLRVDGELQEGSVIQAHAQVAWCGGTPSKGIISWLRRYENSSPVVIVGAEELEYTLMLDDVGACLLLMYTPVTQEGLKGERQFVTTDVIQAAPPHVSNVHVLGDMVEREAIKGVGNYSGGREGMSKFEWLREDTVSGEFKLVSRGTAEYTLCQEDVGLRMMFMYTPVNAEGYQGDPVSAITGRTLCAPPEVSQLRIVGDIQEGNKVAISAAIRGGVEGASRVQWFKTSFPDEALGDGNLEAISTSKISKAFRIPIGAVGFYLAAKYFPVGADGKCGEPTLVFSDIPVEMVPPSLTFLSITGDFIEGETLTASYGYIGGHEGSSQYSWYLHQNESHLGTPIPESAGLLQYHITKEAVNKFVSFKCVPVRDDGLVGEERNVMEQECIQPGSPKLLSLEILGDPIEGAKLQAEKVYWGGVEGSSKLQWFLSKSDGTHQEIKGATGLTYRSCTDDIDCLLCVSCEPIRSDGAKGAAVFSQPFGPVLPALPDCKSLEFCGEPVEGECLRFTAIYRGGEKGACTCIWIRRSTDGLEKELSFGDALYLTAEDVGCHIELIYTPVRKDGVTGISRRVVSDVITYADPVGINLKVPDCCEDKEVTPQRSYFGGVEGDIDFTWFRLQDRMQGSELPNEAEVLGDYKTYIPKLDDVGAYLALRWIPTRKDGKKGKPYLACSSNVVAAASPSVYNVTIKEVSPGTFIGGGLYHGGLEGESQMSWYRQAEDGTRTLIAGATSKLYSVMDAEYNCSLIFGYTPVRQDEVVGSLTVSEPSATIFPDLPRVQKLVLTGKSVEGELLTALAVMPKSEKQQHVWEKYKKDVKYQWSRSCAPGIVDTFEDLTSQKGCSYKVRSEDIGFSICCECVVTDIFGRSTLPVSVVTSTIAPGMPKVSKLEIEGQGYHTNVYTVRGIYSGGKEGDSMIQWFRAMAGCPDLIPIAGEVVQIYEANVDDVGYRLVAIYTPVREDGVEGAPVSTSTDPIAVEPELAKEVKQKTELGAVKFEVLRNRDNSPMKGQQQQQGLGNLERRVLDVNRKRVKVIKPGSKTSFASTEIRGTYAHPFHVETFRNEQQRFKIVIDGESEIDLMVQTQHTRDIVVLVIRGLAQRFNSTPLNLLLNM